MRTELEKGAVTIRGMIDEKIEEYGGKFYPTVGYNRYHEEAEWLRTTLTKVAEEARKEERERIVEWARTHEMPKDMPDDALAGYNEALVLLIAHLSDTNH